MMDENHFENIFAEYKNTVFNLALNYVLNVEDAQDITQEVFVKVYQKYQQFNPNAASLKTWICTITINQCLDFIKAKKTGKRFAFITSIFYGDTTETVEQIATMDHPGIAAEHKQSLEKLLQIIYTLPHNQKTAIILAKIDGYTQQEVAEIMNTTVKAVEALLQRGKQSIAKKINPTEGL